MQNCEGGCETILFIAEPRFYIGGVPDRVALQGVLESTRYVGCIEEVNFDGVLVGLWNFVRAQDTNGCYSRSAPR